MVNKIKEIVGLGVKSIMVDAIFKTKSPILVQNEAVDPSLALLFASSAGPVKPPPTNRYEQTVSTRKQDNYHQEVDEDSDADTASPEEVGGKLSSLNSDVEGPDAEFTSEDEPDLSLRSEGQSNFATQKLTRKRKRTADEDDIEGQYMLRIAKEEERDEEARQANRFHKRRGLMTDQAPDIPEKEDLDVVPESGQEVNRFMASQTNGSPIHVPQHETLTTGKDVDKDMVELEKASRTVFLANVSTIAITDKKAKKILLEHMSSFLGSLHVQEGEKAHKVESLRFRSTAYAGTSIPKKAAFAKKALMNATTKSTNAYVVYSTAFAAREAAKKLNGTMVLDRHLRVDGVAHPGKADHRRCVFVGNLGFVDDESMMDQGGENERKRSKIPSDVEEGLWRQFSKAGSVESVRVVRDEKTRVGKGFAYVQFHDANSVEAALLFHDKKYPPMLPRVLRVTRAMAVKKTALASQHSRPPGGPIFNSTRNPTRERIYNPKQSGEQQSLQGRAGKLLGRAGAARLKKFGKVKDTGSLPNRRLEGITKTPESIVFEGYRASPKSGKPKDLKLGGSGGGKKKGKPRTRSTKRALEWKKGTKTSR